MTSPTNSGQPFMWWKPPMSIPPALSIPPLQSPTNHRRLAIALGEDALIMRPHLAGPYSGPIVSIGWGKDGKVTELDVDDWVEESEVVITVDGCAGLLRGFEGSYLFLITESSVAATLLDPGRPIRAVRTLLSVPLDRVSARALLLKHAAKQAVHLVTPSTEDETDEEEDDATSVSDAGDGASILTSASEGGQSAPEADEGPIVLPKVKEVDSDATVRVKQSWRKSLFGSAAVKPTKPLLPEPEAVAAASAASTKSDVDSAASKIELDHKIVKECARQLQGMYFSEAFDITHSLQHKHDIAAASASPNKDNPMPAFVEPSLHLPLWRRADRRFFWNAHLMAPFIEAGLHAYVLVLQQGFVEQTSVSLPLATYTTLDDPAGPPSPTSVNFDLTIISRRSVERPGLRYQRRGTNVHGSVANFCETEFIVSGERDGKLHVSSFVQTRGSVPVFWKQSPWALKPPPVLDTTWTPAQNQTALAKHFEKQTALYGKQVILNLAEQHGKEATIVDAYREGVAKLASEDVKYIEWDFHEECRGMKYENISKLTAELADDLEEIESFWVAGDQIFSTQTGAIRTNCVDCLDRTNVVQSAISRSVLDRNLVHLGLSTHEEAGMHDELDRAFNELWADNGDAISNEYAGTSALKGDFTRTGKRNLRGALNDASNSVARLLQSTVTDFFKQAVIDYVTGNNLNVFAEFQERMATSDPGEIVRLAEIRLEGRETSTKLVLPEGEDRLAVWTLLSPVEQDVVRSSKYEEKVLLLSTKAIYVISYDYTLQKVTSFTRIPTGDVLGIQRGVYILSSLDAAGRDQTENFGFLLTYRAGATTEQVHTYSMRVKPLRLAAQARPAGSSKASEPTHFFAFKALRRDMIRIGYDGQSQIIDRRSDDGGHGKTGKATILSVVEKLWEAAETVGAVEEGDQEWITEKDIVGLKEAQEKTSWIEKGVHQVKSLIWL